MFQKLFRKHNLEKYISLKMNNCLDFQGNCTKFKKSHKPILSKKSC